MFGRRNAVRKTKSWNEGHEKAADGLFISSGTVKGIIDLAARLSESGYPEDAEVNCSYLLHGAEIKWQEVNSEEPIK